MKTLLHAALLLFLMASCSSSSMSESNSNNSLPMQEEVPDDENMNMKTSLTGNFISDAHPTSGTATVNEAYTILSFTNFKTDNGPVLEVYLATDTSAKTYISLGALKGINGNYEYTLPDNVDYTVYNHVLIWCVDFSVNFGYAVLE